MNTVVDKFQIDAVIVVSGRGERMELGYSKVLLRVNNITLLEHTIRQLESANVNRLFILCDTVMYKDKECAKLVQQYPNITLYQRKKVKYDSTFQILKEFIIANHSVSSKILFEYGHSPHPSQYYNYISKLEMNNGVIATLFSSSTRKDTAIGRCGKYIEPPYVISSELINLSSAGRWSEFFDENRKETVEIDLLDAPNEFNSHDEYEKYSEYVRNNYLPRILVDNTVGFPQRFTGVPTTKNLVEVG